MYKRQELARQRARYDAARARETAAARLMRQNPGNDAIRLAYNAARREVRVIHGQVSVLAAALGEEADRGKRRGWWGLRG